MESLLYLLLTAIPGWLAVIALARVLKLIPRFRRWRLRHRLVVCHTFLILALVAFSPISIWLNWGSPYGDLYRPFCFVPGFPIHSLAARLSDPAFPRLLPFMEPFPASVMTVIILPGLYSILIGGAVWFLAGTLWSAIAGESPEPSLFRRQT